MFSTAGAAASGSSVCAACTKPWVGSSAPKVWVWRWRQEEDQFSYIESSRPAGILEMSKRETQNKTVDTLSH